MTGGYRKIKLFSLMVALIVAGLAVVGGTWASGVIYKGEATHHEMNNVKFEYFNGSDYVSVNETTNVFSNSVWCPGRTEVFYFRVQNGEDFPVDCDLYLDVTDNELAGQLTLAVIDNDADWSEDAQQRPGSWQAFSKHESAQLTVLDTAKAYLVGERKSHLAKENAWDYITVAIHMHENTPSTYEGKQAGMKFRLQINATDPQTTESNADNGNNG